ncbi:MAG TPA: CocE/NonD family hydrolase [Candidatus Binatia bacterium]|nr:CocE/NonD family hydrolase [Candidatus Binatia bacterium]
MIEEKDIKVAMRDGVEIALRIYRPNGSGPFPTLFAASPYRYDNNLLPCSPLFLWRETGPIEWYVEEHGYAYVHMDVRGSGVSGGEFGLWSKDEQRDLYEVIEWIAAQSWSNGKVGGIGQSYFCISQWLMAVQNPPHLACIAPYDGLNDPYRFVAYHGGIESNFALYWFNSSVRVPNQYPANGDNPRSMPTDMYYVMAQHPLRDDFWTERSAWERLEQIKIPVFSVGVFAKQDLHLVGNIDGFLRASSVEKKLYITGTATPITSQSDYAKIEFHRDLFLPFYDKYLKGNKTGWDDRPRISYQVHNTGNVRVVEQWPPSNVRKMRFFLAAGPSGTVKSLNDGALTSKPPSSGSGSTSYDYPHPSWVLGNVHVGPTGPDPAAGVLTFTSEALERDLELAGHGKLIVYASSNRKDIDIIVKVSEQFAQPAEERAKGVQPRYAIVTKGWLRASHHEGRDSRFSSDDIPVYTHAKATPILAGKAYRLEIPLLPHAWRFSQGSRIRVELSCADSPVTDFLFSHIYRPDKHGTDTIHHDAEHPSELILPVLND